MPLDAGLSIRATSYTPIPSLFRSVRSADGQLKLLALVACNITLAYVSSATEAYAESKGKSRLLSSPDLARTLRGNRTLVLRTMTRAWYYLISRTNRSSSSLKALFAGAQDKELSSTTRVLDAKSDSSVSGAVTLPTKRQKVNNTFFQSFINAIECSMPAQQRMHATAATPAHNTLGVNYTSLLRHNLPTLLMQTVMVTAARSATAFADLLR